MSTRSVSRAGAGGRVPPALHDGDAHGDGGAEVRARQAGSAIAAFFCEPDSAFNLAVVRIAVGLSVLRAAPFTFFVSLAELPHELIRTPLLMGWLRPLIPTTP